MWLDPCEGDHLLELVEQLATVGRLAAHQGFGHQRSRRLRDGAAHAGERDIVDRTLFNTQIDFDVISAEGIVAASPVVRILRFAKIARSLAVFQHDLLVQAVNFPGHPKIAWTRCTPSMTKDSTPHLCDAVPTMRTPGTRAIPRLA